MKRLLQTVKKYKRKKYFPHLSTLITIWLRMSGQYKKVTKRKHEITFTSFSRSFFFLSSSFFFLLSGIKSSSQLSSLLVKNKSRSFRIKTSARTWRQGTDREYSLFHRVYFRGVVDPLKLQVSRSGRVTDTRCRHKPVHNCLFRLVTFSVPLRHFIA